MGETEILTDQRKEMRYRHRETDIGKQREGVDRQTDRQKDRQIGRQTDRQKDRQIGRQI